MSEVDLDGASAMRQAEMTAHDYLLKAYIILEENYEGWTTGDAIALANVIAKDFHTAMMSMKMQEIRDAIYELSSFVEKMGE